LAKQSGLQGRKQRQSLFAQGGQVAPNASKSLCASPRAEATGDLLLNFHHPQISLGQIVVERHTQIFQSLSSEKNRVSLVPQMSFVPREERDQRDEGQTLLNGCAK
jgi:hypothetical protein